MRIFPSQIRLLDVEQDKFSYTPRMNSLFANIQGLFTIQKKRSLLIAWPASAIALTAKGKGVLIFPALLSSWIVDVAFFLLTGSALALFCCLPFPTRKVKVLAHRSVVLIIAWLRMLGRHPFIMLSLPSAYLLLVYPPLWKDVDALCQLILPADVTNIYHFPALFCFSARLIIWFGDCFSTWRSPDLLALQKPTLQGIYALVVFQHFVLVLSLGILCKTLTKREGCGGCSSWVSALPRVCIPTFCCVDQRRGRFVRLSLFSRLAFAFTLFKVTKQLTGLATVFPSLSRLARDISIFFSASG